MKYYRNELGAYLEVDKDNDYAIYSFLKLMQENPGDDKFIKEFNTFIEFMEKLDLIYPEKWNTIKIFAEKNALIVCAVHSDDPANEDISTFLDFKASVKKEKIVTLNSKSVNDMYSKFRQGIDINTKNAKIATSKGSSLQNIYRIMAKDMPKYSKYAEYFFIQQGVYYMKALPNVYLDDFLDKAYIQETSLKRIEASQFG